MLQKNTKKVQVKFFFIRVFFYKHSLFTGENRKEAISLTYLYLFYALYRYFISRVITAGLTSAVSSRSQTGFQVQVSNY